MGRERRFEEVTAKLKFKPTAGKSLQHTAESQLGLGEQEWGSLELPLPLRQWGTCWGHPIVEGSLLLSPQHLLCHLLRVIS